MQRFERDLSPQEIAARLDVPSTRVRTWLVRGAASLRDCLRSKLPTEVET